MVVCRVFFSGPISLSLDRDRMYQDRAFQVPRIIECLDEPVKAVPIYGSDIFEFEGREYSISYEDNYFEVFEYTTYEDQDYIVSYDGTVYGPDGNIIKPRHFSTPI